MYVDVCCARGPRGIGNVQCRAVSDHSSRPPPTPPPRLEPGSRHLRTPRTLRTPGQPSDCSNFRGSRAMYVEMYYTLFVRAIRRPGRPAPQPIGPSSGLGQPAGLPELHGLVDSVARDVLRSGRGQVRSGHIPGCVTRYKPRDPGMITRLTAYTRTGSDN